MKGGEAMQKYALEVTKLIETKGGYALERRLSNGVEIIERPGGEGILCCGSGWV